MTGKPRQSCHTLTSHSGVGVRGLASHAERYPDWGGCRAGLQRHMHECTGDVLLCGWSGSASQAYTHVGPEAFHQSFKQSLSGRGRARTQTCATGWSG